MTASPVPAGDRDYGAEMDEVLDLLIAGSETFSVPLLARQLHSKLASGEYNHEYPGLLQGWLQQNASSFLAVHIRHVLASQRARSRASAQSFRFHLAARAFEETADPAELNAFLAWHKVDATGTQRRAGDMTRSDLEFVAGKYEMQANTASLLAHFYRAVAGKLTVSGQQVRDVMTEADYERLYRSIVGTAA